MREIAGKIQRPQRPFSGFALKHGLLCDLAQGALPSTLRAWKDDDLALEAGATHFGYVHRGTCRVSSASGRFTLQAGMVFAIPGIATVSGNEGIVVSRYGYRGFFQIGGPVENEGRLRYMDGCTDSLLIAPVMRGDPCLNLLYFPPGVTQTPHTHPSARIGIVASGSGVCVTPEGEITLRPGEAFVIHPGGLHSFNTGEDAMRIIAYHPDSDFGPTHQDHPMLNRTLVDGRPAALVPEILTREAPSDRLAAGGWT
jgi:quercetin dioxygenase-like cupin family protein